MFTKEIAESIINKVEIPEYHPHWRAVGYLEAIEKAQVLEKVMSAIDELKIHHLDVFNAISNALAKWEKIK